MKFSERILEKATAVGFDAAGWGPAQPSSGDEFCRWLESGRSGGMTWLAKDVERRIHPAAQTAIVCGLSYFVENPPAAFWNDPLRGRISRYAWGRDYHDVIRPMLEELAEFVRAETGWVTGVKTHVDTGPVLERDVAVQAGLGCVGKNTNLIHPEFGSYLFLGEVLLDAEVESALPNFQGPSAMENPCADCSRCLNHCPTGALMAPYVLDARKCLSYLTIEHRASIPEELRPKLGNRIFGCDECQQACPQVIRLSRRGRQRFLEFDEARCAPWLTEVMALDEAGFRERFAGTPVLRAKRSGLLRNVAIALGNSGASNALPILGKAARDPDPLIREHAEWAITQLQRNR